MALDVFDGVFVALATDDAVFARCAVRDLLKDLGLGVQVVDIESVTKGFLRWC